MSEHQKADYEYQITVVTVLSVSCRAKAIFESSEVEEKTQLLNFLLQNCELQEKKLSYKLKIPFEGILPYAKSSSMLRGEDSNL